MFGGVLLALPVHAGGLAVIDLHAVHADIALSGFWIAGHDARKSDERAAILRPGGEDGQFEQVDSLPSIGLAAMDDLFAGGVFGRDDFGEEAADLGELRQQLQLVHEAGWCLRLDESADAVGDGVERVGFERELHTALRPELVHQDFGAGISSDILEEQRWAAGFRYAFAEFGGAIGDLGHFEIRADGLADAAEFARLLKLFDPFAKVGVWHVLLLDFTPPRGGVYT